MIPAILGLGGLTARIVATAVIPRVVRAISSSLSTTKAIDSCRLPAVEGISSAPKPAPAPILSGVSAPLRTSRKWGYAGLWHHAPSGLDLATYRAYDAANKRWISRDPLGEGVDYNLYRYCGNNPITFLDPGGLLRRNANGSLQVEVVGPGTIQAPTRNNPGGLGSEGEIGSGFNVNLITNDGKHKIKAFLNKEPGRKPYFTTDCHGRTFADGKFWINNDQIGDLLEGDGYTITDDPQVGDIVIYRDENNKIVHSMTVSGVDADTGAVTVTGQAGTDPTIYSAPMGEGFNSGTITTPTVYHLGQ